MRRGDIWWAELPDPSGSGPGYRRPVLVVQADAFNRSRIQTAVVVALTSNLSLAAAPGNLRLSPRDTGLPKPSVVNVSQLFTLDKSLLSSKCGQLPIRLLHEVEAGLRLVLEL